MGRLLASWGGGMAPLNPPMRTDLLPFWDGTPGGPPSPNFWPFDREYLENGKSQRYMSIRA